MRISQEEILNRIRMTLQAVAPEAKAVLYGSRARGDAREDSDWDILILIDKDRVDGVDYVHTHNGVVGQIGMRFVKAGKLTKDEGRLHARLLQARVSGDYNDFFDFTEEETMEFLQPTRNLLKRLEELILNIV